MAFIKEGRRREEEKRLGPRCCCSEEEEWPISTLYPSILEEHLL